MVVELELVAIKSHRRRRGGILRKVPQYPVVLLVNSLRTVLAQRSTTGPLMVGFSERISGGGEGAAFVDGLIT